jgi:hypothetical protein
MCKRHASCVVRPSLAAAGQRHTVEKGSAVVRPRRVRTTRLDGARAHRWRPGRSLQFRGKMRAPNRLIDTSALAPKEREAAAREFLETITNIP